MSSRLTVGILVWLVSLAPVHGQTPPTVIARTGAAAPGTSAGVTYGSYMTAYPAVAGGGTDAYFSDLNGTGITTANNSGVWVGPAESPALLLRSGDVVPGTTATLNGYDPNSANNGFQSTPAVNASGTMMVHIMIGGTGVTTSNNKAIVFGSSYANLQVLARTGQAAPGAGTAVWTDLYSDNFPAINDAGQMVFGGQLSGSSGTVGIWFGSSAANLQLVARQGQPAPGTTDGSVFDGLAELTTGPRLNAGGTVVFKAFLNNNTPNGSTGLYTWSAGTYTLVGQYGAQAPGLPAGVVYSHVTFDSPKLSDNGRVAFGSGLDGPGVTTSNNFAFFSGAPGAIQLVARQGDPAAGFASGVTYNSFTGASVGIGQASNGKVAFYGTVSGPGITAGTNDQAIWVGDPGSLSVLARTGDQAPGAAAGVHFGTLVTTLGLGPVVNANGVVMFKGSVTNGASFTGLWAGTPGNLTLLLRTGETINGLTVSDIDYMASYESNSGQAALTDANVWTAYVLFATGGSAIVTGVVPVPEPSAGLAAAAGLCVAAGVRRLVRRRRLGRDPSP